MIRASAMADARSHVNAGQCSSGLREKTRIVATVMHVHIPPAVIETYLSMGPLCLEEFQNQPSEIIPRTQINAGIGHDLLIMLIRQATNICIGVEIATLVRESASYTTMMGRKRTVIIGSVKTREVSMSNYA